MNRKSKFWQVSRVQSAVALCIALTSTAWAEHNPSEITITAGPPVRISGFDGVPWQELPISASNRENFTVPIISFLDEVAQEYSHPIQCSIFT